MSYAANSNIPLKDLTNIYGQPGNETIEVLTPSAVFQLDNGDLVAMQYQVKRLASNSLSCRISAWLVDAEGDPQQSVDARGVPVLVDFKHTASGHQLTTLGPVGLAAALRDLVFGEAPGDPAPIPWSQDLRDEVNIRYAIATARATGETIDLVTAPTPIMEPLPVE